jgi:hypothetical protein
MQFTAQEMKMIERLREDERSWLRGRWIIVAMVPLAFGCAVYFGCVVGRMLNSKTLSEVETAMLIAVFWPQVLLMLLVVAVLMALAIRDWRGKAERALLLRLIEEHEKEADSNEKRG